MNADLIPGVEITLGNAQYILPPAGLDVLIDHGEFMRGVLSGETDVDIFSAEHANKVADIIHATLRMNYPSIDRATVTRGLNLSNTAQIFSSALLQNFPKPPAEFQGSGKEGDKPGESTGAASKLT